MMYILDVYVSFSLRTYVYVHIFYKSAFIELAYIVGVA